MQQIGTQLVKQDLGLEVLFIQQSQQTRQLLGGIYGAVIPGLGAGIPRLALLSGAEPEQHVLTQALQSLGKGGLGLMEHAVILLTQGHLQLPGLAGQFPGLEGGGMSLEGVELTGRVIEAIGGQQGPDPLQQGFRLLQEGLNQAGEQQFIPTQLIDDLCRIKQGVCFYRRKCR